MELRHLVYFVTVAEERNFTRASERLRVVQSGVSAAIRALERELGVQLFDRSSQRVALTDAGAALLPAARATIDAAQAARDAVDEVRGGLRGTLRIGTLISVGFVDLPGLLGQFRAEHPGVDLRLRAAPSGSAGLARALMEGELDVAFVSLAGRPPTGLSVRILVAEPIVAVLPSAHHLASRSALALADLADEPFVDSPLGYGNRTEVDRGFAAAGLQRRVALEVADIATVPQYVRNGLGVALIPRFAVPPGDAPPGDGLTVLPVTGTRLRWTFGVATASARRQSAALRALLEMVDAHRLP
ncbi:LysR family transcriptional regulator [Dactylosporangium fulvum]|uniref:LysR family transcriptional regulator n=1 Tax=Dactylosporangium fulvum TaxID=53359 RepID=A0ABY5VNG7_9ACTN|nr:LysR family transcriptional regulator [Dactylosporangium fulvum]UWP78695.1 LysR family transcriptional regulator [Dactylosporangium fulvum]